MFDIVAIFVWELSQVQESHEDSVRTFSTFFTVKPSTLFPVVFSSRSLSPPVIWPTVNHSTCFEVYFSLILSLRFDHFLHFRSTY